ncbi:anthrone oxygenase family protein [Actinopolymorpha sp. NPDC004070]|uniref:anthrone oxygenase family protein n=1 Tax=Actinopolymorpha sp. NPDC004070 TaxID=3154548 RepID=UPI0033BA2952
MRRRRLTGRLLTLAQLGHAHWFFGNLYEAVVRVPDRLAAGAECERAHSPLGPGSPLRYYVPAVPATFPASLAAVWSGWDDCPESRRWLVVAASCSISGAAVTAVLVPLNLRLFFATEQSPAAEREELLRTWYRLNALRLATTAAAWIATRQAAARITRIAR